MDGPSAKKSTSLETLVIQNITNVQDLKVKLNEIISIGKDYEYDVSSCLKSLINNSDQEIVHLTIQAISELAKCEEKRQIYAQKEIIENIVVILRKDITPDRFEIVKQCCRALGNLCCDCDSARDILLECDGVKVLINLLEECFSKALAEIKMFSIKTLLNFVIGGKQYTEAVVEFGLLNVLQKVLVSELYRKDMDDDIVSTVLLILSVINDNQPEFLFDTEINTAVLNVLTDTTSVEISELCLDHLHAQAEHDSVKNLLANRGGVQLVCSRLEQLVHRHSAGELNAEDSEVEAVMKQACDLIVIVLTGDEAMHTLYHKGVGEVYLSMVKWLDSPNYHLLSTAVLAIGNFARQDDYCTQMMEDKIFDKLLDIFEIYNGFGVRMQKEPDKMHPIDTVTVTKIQHAVLSALRNLTVAVCNKRVAAAQGRAAPLLLAALPAVSDHLVAYKMLAAIRMLVDGQEGVARQLACDEAALRSVARWGQARDCAGAAGEAPRLLAWATKHLGPSPHYIHILQVEGCIACLVNMLVSCHTVMQNEAILAITLISIESLNKTSQEFDYEKSLITQLINSEIGKHISVLVDTNCAKLPVEVAENLLAFLDITSKKNTLAADYKEAKVHEALKKFSDSRNDLSSDMENCISGVLMAISDNANGD